MGRDPDHELVAGRSRQVRRRPLPRWRTWRRFSIGIPLGDVTTSMTINSPAAMIFAMYLVVAERQGVPWETLSRNDSERHPERVHRSEGMHLSAAALDAADHRHLCLLRATGAALEQHLGERLSHPRSGRDGRPGAGLHARRRHRLRASGRSTPAWTSTTSRHACRSSSTRIPTSSKRSRSIGPPAASGRTSCATGFMPSRNDRWKLRFHTQTAGVSLTAQQPYNNVVRMALQAMAAVLGGTNSLHTNSLDEALALPTEKPRRSRCRTQQIIAHETGVADVVDPLGGSYFLEALTARSGAGGAGVLRSHRRDGRHGRGHRGGISAARDRRQRVSLPAGRRTRRAGHRRRQCQRRERRGRRDAVHRRAGRRSAVLRGWPR